MKGKSFSSIKEVEDENLFKQDKENSLAIENENGKGWWYLKDLLSNKGLLSLEASNLFFS